MCVRPTFRALSHVIFFRAPSLTTHTPTRAHYASTRTSNSQSTCSACPTGTFNAQLGQESVASCDECPAGTFGEKEGAIKNERISRPDPKDLSAEQLAATPCDCSQDPCIPPDTCENCPAGTWSAATGINQDYHCVDCAVGKFSTLTGMALELACTDCPSGRYQDELAAISKGDSCPFGTICTRACKHCPAGMFSGAESEDSIDACQNCTAGKYSTNRNVRDGTAYGKGAPSCTVCPMGRYSGVHASTTLDNCDEW
jgi:hypothetical protein